MDEVSHDGLKFLRPVALKTVEPDPWYQSEQPLVELRAGLDSLQLHLELLHQAHDVYEPAVVLTQQARRLEQITDVPARRAIPMRVYRDTLDRIVEAQESIEKVQHDQFVQRVVPPLVAEMSSMKYSAGLIKSRSAIDRLTTAETEPAVANNLAANLAYSSKNLRLFWDGVLQALYLRFADQLANMRTLIGPLNDH